MNKRLCLIILSALIVILSSQSVEAQCAGISLEVQPNSEGFYAVKVLLDQTYNEAITVNGTIRYETNLSTETAFSVTVPAGYVTAQSSFFFEIDPQGDLNILTNAVSPTIVTKNGNIYSTQGFASECSPITTELTQIFKGLNTTILQSQDSSAIESYFNSVNPDIISYVQSTYGEDLDDICEGKADWIFLAGFVIAINEAYGQNGANGYEGSVAFHGIPTWTNYSIAAMSVLKYPWVAPPWVDCAIAAVSGYHSLDALFSGYSALLSGSVTTGIQIFKNVVKRYLGWVGVAIAVYEFGGCMGYW